jgi:hypothetical protein
MRLSLLGNRTMTTFRKLPMTAPVRIARGMSGWAYT